jgi:hypothetical protein
LSDDHHQLRNTGWAGNRGRAIYLARQRWFRSAGPGTWQTFVGEGGDPQSSVDTSKNSQVFYGFDNAGTFTITGETPVPLPAGAWLLLSGLGGLLPVVRKRKLA